MQIRHLMINKKDLRVANHHKRQWGLLDPKKEGVRYVGSRRWLREDKPKPNNKYFSYGVDVNSITESRLRYERANNFIEEPNQGIGETLNNKKVQNND